MGSIKRVLLLIGLYSNLCAAVFAQKEVVIPEAYKGTPFCYTGQSTGLDSLIKIDGYYLMWTPRLGHPLDTVWYACAFYKDGLFINFLNTQPNGGGGMWGRYLVDGDTIKAISSWSPGDMSWERRETWYEILNDSTIQELYRQSRIPITTATVQNYQIEGKGRYVSPGRFIRYTQLRNTDEAWLKKKKWFWFDEEDYKRWKKERKANRK